MNTVLRPEGLCKNPQGEFKRNSERMRTAEKALLDYVYDDRLALARRNSKHRALASYVPGDLVYYWRYQAEGKGKGGSFFGPARVLATETRETLEGRLRPSSVIWVMKGDRLLKTSPEQLRKASERESVLEELATQGEPLPWTFTNLTSSLGKQRYEDISEESADQETGRPAKRLKS